MVFPSFEFLLFFGVVLILNWSLKKWPLVWWLFLLIASYYFYSVWNLKFLYILFGVSFFNYLSGLAIEKLNLKKFFLAISIIFNLGILILFKYYDFFRVSFESLLVKAGFFASLPLLQIILPLGLSFYIFRVISYNIDIYRGKIPASRSILDFFIYVSFFPQLLSGPIARASEFIPQLANGGAKKIENFYENLNLIILGLFKKIFISNYLAIYFTDDVFAVPQNHSSLMILMACFAYCFLIYFDFSSYSDMAIGFAGMMGFKSPRNFDYPYLSLNIKEFWRRWHITLSSWFRDYVYIPLGGNRKGAFREYFNLILVMILAGLWHGAGANFIIWGGIQGLGLAAVHAFGKPSSSKIKNFFAWLGTFLFITFSWIFFRSNTFSDALTFIYSLFSNFKVQDTFAIYGLAVLAIGFLFIILERQMNKALIWAYERLPFPILMFWAIFAIIILFSLSPDTTPNFIYFNF